MRRRHDSLCLFLVDRLTRIPVTSPIRELSAEGQQRARHGCQPDCKGAQHFFGNRFRPAWRDLVHHRLGCDEHPMRRANQDGNGTTIRMRRYRWARDAGMTQPSIPPGSFFVDPINQTKT